jgi:hypothetical protein
VRSTGLFQKGLVQGQKDLNRADNLQNAARTGRMVVAAGIGNDGCADGELSDFLRNDHLPRQGKSLAGDFERG